MSGTGQWSVNAAIETTAVKDAAIADVEAQHKMMLDVRDDEYKVIDQQRSKVGLGVAGSPDYGNDSPLLGAMGFVRKSEKKSGLTRKKKPTE